MAERLFDDDAPPCLALFLRQPRGAETVDHGTEEPFGDGEIKQHPAAERLLAIELGQARAEAAIGVGFEEIACEIGHHPGELLPGLSRRICRQMEFAALSAWRWRR